MKDLVTRLAEITTRIRARRRIRPLLLATALLPTGTLLGAFALPSMAFALPSTDPTDPTETAKQARVVLQAVGCSGWGDVPANFTPEAPLDDTDGRYALWGPIDEELVYPITEPALSEQCELIDGVAFRVSGTQWGTGLLEARAARQPPTEPPPEHADNVTGPRTEAEPPAWTTSSTSSTSLSGSGAGSPSDATPTTVLEPSTTSPPATSPASPAEAAVADDEETSTLPGRTGQDGHGTLAVAIDALSTVQRDALVGGVGLWVEAADVPGEFANLRCHADRYNADNLEVIRADSADQSYTCVLYVVQRPAVGSPPPFPPPTVPGAVTGAPTGVPAVDPTGDVIQPVPPESGPITVPVSTPTPTPIAPAEPEVSFPPDGGDALDVIADPPTGAGDAGGIVVPSPAGLPDMRSGSVTTVPGDDASDDGDEPEAGGLGLPVPDGSPLTSSTSPATTTTTVVATTSPSATTTTTPAGARVVDVEPLPAAERAAPAVPVGRTRLHGVTAVVLAVLFLTGLGLSVLAARRPLS